MRITFATGIYPPDIGGPATYVSHLATELHARGWGVNVVTYGEATAASSPFPVRRVGRSASLPLRYLSFLKEVRRASRPEELIYAQDPLSSGFPGLLAARSRECAMVVKIVGDLAWEIGCELGLVADGIEDFQRGKYGPVIALARRVERSVAKNADRVLVPSQYLKSLVVGWGVPAERIDVVHNSLPETETAPPSRDEARRRLSFGEETVLLSAGRLVPWKGFDRLIRLMPALLTASSSTRLVIVGSGPCEKRLKELASELNLGPAVTFAGPLDANAMQLHLRASDALVLASSYEGFSHLLFEALRAGVPVVATDVGGNRELIEDGKSGILVPFHESERLTEALIELGRNPALREDLARGGLERARQLTWKSMVERTVDILQRASDRLPLSG